MGIACPHRIHIQLAAEIRKGMEFLTVSLATREQEDEVMGLVRLLSILRALRYFSTACWHRKPMISNGIGRMVMRNRAVARSCFPRSAHSPTMSSSRIKYLSFTRDLALERRKEFPLLKILHRLDDDIQREGYFPE